MKCLSCNAKINPGARFCSECGAKLEIKCPSCNALLTNFSKFCSECGAPLEDSGTVNSTGQKTSENKIRENIDNGDSGCTSSKQSELFVVKNKRHFFLDSRIN